jgi:hypothetical protein|tara:strand:+ start:1453 stop:1656 length:204 start_codon:yes stop_codon:yes gene_type:complete
MGQVNKALQDVKEQIEELLIEPIDLQEVKEILKNKYVFNDNSNPYLMDEKVIEDLYNEILTEYEEYR